MTSYIHLRYIVKLIVRSLEFPKLLDAGNQTMMEILWNADDIPKSNKLKFTDNFMTTQSDQTRREYRRWRFEVDRETVWLTDKQNQYRLFKVPKFVNNQTPVVQNTLIKILERQPDLGRDIS